MEKFVTKPLEKTYYVIMAIAVFSTAYSLTFKNVSQIKALLIISIITTLIASIYSFYFFKKEKSKESVVLGIAFALGAMVNLWALMTL